MSGETFKEKSNNKEKGFGRSICHKARKEENEKGSERRREPRK